MKPEGRPEVVCLCGSCKFWEEFQKQNSRLTLEGKIVLSVGVGKTVDGKELTRLTKSKLDVLHLRKIDLADSIFVIDVGKYIGESTEREIEYAISQGKQVNYLSQDQRHLLIEDLGLAVRASKAMDSLGIKTIGDLCNKSESELFSCHNFGQTTLIEIVRKLEDRGLCLKEYED